MARSPHVLSAREFRVSFADRLAGAVMVDTRTPAPPPHKPALPPPADSFDTPVHIANDARPAAPPADPLRGTTPPAPPTDALLAEIGMQLASDRRAIDAVLGSLKAAAGRVQADHSALLVACRKLAVELAVNVATKLLHERITADQFNVEQMVRDMAAGMPDDEVVSVRLNPRDLELLEKRLDGEPLLSGPTDPQLVADHALARGACRVEGRAMMSMTDLPGKLGDIRDGLLRRMADAGA